MDSRTGYRVPPSQMEDVTIDNRDTGVDARSRTQHVSSNGKHARCLNVPNQWDFYMRYKIAVFTGIISIIALLFFTASIIYMAFRSADGFDSLHIEKVIEEEPVTGLTQFKDIDAEDFDWRANAIRRVGYDIIPDPLMHSNLIQVQAFRKRETRSIPSQIIANTPRDKTVFRRVNTGRRASIDVDPIPNNRDSMEEIYHNDIDVERKNDKRQTEREERLSDCQKRSEHCKLVLNHMQELIQATGDNVKDLSNLVKKMDQHMEIQKKDPRDYQDFLQCVRCGDISTNEEINDSVVFVDNADDAPAIYEQHGRRGKNSHVKNVKSIMAMLDTNPHNWSGGYSASSYSSSGSSEEYRTKLNKAKSGPIQAELDTPMSKSQSKPNVVKTVQVSRSKEFEDGTVITNKVRNTTIIKTKSEGGSERKIVNVEKSTDKIGNINFGEPIRHQAIPQADNGLNGPTGQSAPPYRSGEQSPSGWSENTKSGSITEVFRGSDTNSRSDDDVSQGRMSNDRAMEPRIMTGPQFQPSRNDGNSMTLPTAETMKTSQQVQYTPSMPWMPYSVCYFGTPPTGTPAAPLKQTMPGMISFPASSPGSANYPFAANQFPARRPFTAGQIVNQGFGPMQFQQQPQQGPLYGPNQQFQQGFRVGPSGPGSQNFAPNFGNFPTGPGSPARTPYYCQTFMPSPTFQFPTIPGVSEFQRNAESSRQGIDGDLNEWAVPNPDGSMYSGYSSDCDANSHRCSDGSRCVSRTLWCDGRVDCPDASDETRCSCRDRISKERLCDGYFDCPHGEDELGCFGCSKNHFSCDDRERRYQKENCVMLSQRCDGVAQCSNGKDEKDCSILTGTYIEGQDRFTVGYADGFLHKNWHGRWYPACSATTSWATDACVSESCEPTAEPPMIRLEYTPPGTYRGQYILQTDNGQIRIVPTCYDRAVYVNCARIPCGTRDVSSGDGSSSFDLYDDSIVATSRQRMNETSRQIVEEVANRIKEVVETPGEHSDGLSHSEVENTNRSDIVGSDMRIVGGRASRPKAWPFLVAIFKDGYLHCGGAIVHPEWILTAAHCVYGFPAHYYEITAGLLRRYSFSPTSQIRRAYSIRIHPDYVVDTMKNDLALIRLNEPLRFNRWVRATCLPESSSSGPLWKNSPLPDTTCVAVGWGATVEHGRNPDQLREVEIPILPRCKYAEDQNDAEICAGLLQGGRDSCQGDSGGPLLCKYPDPDNTWYVAALVSHGIGCARPNEPGAYTRVGKFVDWINGIIDSGGIIGSKPLQTCPGFTCGGGLGKCIPLNKRCDRIVNCLDAEDEMNCQAYKEFMWNNRNESGVHDSNWVGQVEPTLLNDLNKDGDGKSGETGNVATSKESPRHSVFTMDEEENSTTDRVETVATSTSVTLKNDSDATSANGTSSERPMTTTSEPQTSSQRSIESTEITRFTCTRVIQSIPISERCNRIIDCEDGTDEDNCTCKDYLANSYPIAICDGHLDCYDGSDEENCAICTKDEFVCSRSGKCIEQSKVCDRRIDCPYMEDELDCFALTSVDHVNIDLDKRPHLNLEGVVAKRDHGMWRPVCQRHNATVRDRLSNDFCVYFGFRGAQFVDEITVQNSHIEVRMSTKDNLIPYEYPPSYVVPEDGVETCRGLYVRCKPVLSADTNHLLATNYKTNNLSYLWPWQASIFVEGNYHCPAILLEYSWLLTSSRCVQNLDLNGNFTMALLGMAPTYLYANSPYQQISAVDAFKVMPKLDAALVHLETPVRITRYVQPIFVQKKIFPAMKNDMCVATGVDSKHRTKTTLLQTEPKNCPACHRCYKNATVEDCRNKTSTNWSGTIVCRGSGTWYPAAIFHEEDLLCGFQTVKKLTSIDYGNAHFTEIMEEKLPTSTGPACDGMRCPMGKCIPWTKVCDGIDDCRDGSDEDMDYCQDRQDRCETDDGIDCKCSKSELRCANGQCVPKEAYCDYQQDCDDGSDEPTKCTCANYLKLTAPERLCDNVRHCFDKSDESSELCYCKDASFKCTNRNATVTETCVSQDFVCDGEPDCANGEDEKSCRKVLGTLKDPPGTGQVLHSTSGVWHSECFPSPIVAPTEFTELCKSMGYANGTSLEIDHDANPYGPALVPRINEFYIVRFNEKTWLSIRDPKPLVTLVPAEETCHRAFVKCT